MPNGAQADETEGAGRVPQPHLPAKTSSMPANIRRRGSKHFLAVVVLAAAASLAACAGTVSEHRATPILASAGSIRLTSERPGLLVDDGFHHPEVLSHLEERYEINGSAPQPDRFASVDSTGPVSYTHLTLPTKRI